jgi:hypothetical protein
MTAGVFPQHFHSVGDKNMVLQKAQRHASIGFKTLSVRWNFVA